MNGREATPAHAPVEGEGRPLQLVVGLGNPGNAYSKHRHNVGYWTVNRLARRLGIEFTRRSGLVELGEGEVDGRRVVLAKPSTYMNVSGGPVAGLVQYFGLTPDHVVVVHDELDIPFADVRLKIGGGEGGHNGLRDITKALGTKDYVRVRVGVGRPPGRMDPADFVLKDFAGAERKELPWLVDAAADAVEMVLTQGLEKAQQVLHTRA